MPEMQAIQELSAMAELLVEQAIQEMLEMPEFPEVGAGAEVARASRLLAVSVAPAPLEMLEAGLQMELEVRAAYREAPLRGLRAMPGPPDQPGMRAELVAGPPTAELEMLEPQAMPEPVELQAIRRPSAP